MERIKLFNTEFIPTGSTLLDLAIGGGWASGRVFNIVGDKSSGKTLLAIECYANFHRMYPKGRMRYGEAEAAFDDEYAQTLGFPDCVEKPEKPLETVEDFYKDLQEFSSKPGPSLYILDSLDALSDEAEKGRDIAAENTYGTGKAKKMSELFRRLVQSLSANNCTLGVISQVRENIGVTFGESKSRSGGKALDFYSSQIVWLAEIEKLKRTYKEQERVVGVAVKAKVKKCKVGLPFREAEFKIIFGYGIDDQISILDWLASLKAYTKEEFVAGKKLVDKVRDDGDVATLQRFTSDIVDKARVEWVALERHLAPKVRKYV